MNSITIWTDTPHEEQVRKKNNFLMTAEVGDRVIYQGPNQMDTTWYVVIEVDGKKELQWTHVDDDYH